MCRSTTTALYFNVALTRAAAFTDIGNFIDNYLGPSGQATINFGSPRVDPHAFNQAYFAQDDLKFSPELTLNFGLRYEYRRNPENSLALSGDRSFQSICSDWHKAQRQ